MHLIKSHIKKELIQLKYVNSKRQLAHIFRKIFYQTSILEIEEVIEAYKLSGRLQERNYII